MDRPDGSREMVFCHECENEWYRSQHGLTCPTCHSDFVEIIEADHDPRAETATDDFGGNPPQWGTHVSYRDHSPNHVPDPDEDDIDHVRFAPNPSGDGYTMHGVFSERGHANPRQNPVRNEGHGAASATDAQQTVFQNFQTMLGGIMGSFGLQPQQQPQQAHPQAQQQQFGHQHHHRFHHEQSSQPQVYTSMRTMTFGFNNGNVFYSSSNGPADEGLQPRDPNNPTPGQPVQDLHNMFNQMFADMNGPRGPGGAAPAAHPFATFFNMLANPHGTHGDGVYTQEAFDRILTQLMEQNSTGSAPGPANPDDISSLPKKKVDKSMLGEQGNADCSICMDSVEIGQEVTELYCGHWFHDDCISMWLNSHDTCPHCRMGLREAREKKNNSAGDPSKGPSAPDAPSGSSRRPPSRRASSSNTRRRRSSGQSSGTRNAGNSDNNQDPNGSMLDRARQFFTRSSSNS